MTRKKNSILAPTALVAAFAAALLSGCTTTEKERPEPPPPPADAGPQFAPSGYSQFPPSAESDWENARKAFLGSCGTGSFASLPLWEDACRKAAGPGSAVAFFESSFMPWRVTFSSEGEDSPHDTGLMTGYYEPVLQASAAKTTEYAWPVLGTPDDLLVIDLSGLYPDLKGKRIRGKLSGRKVIPYDDRARIDERQDLERYAIAWLRDPVEQLFLQIQGSGQLEIQGRGRTRVSYDDVNGHPYRAVANWLIKNGEMTRSEASMQRIKKWAQRNPGKVREMLAYNPSYVFFREAVNDDLSLGPRGAQGVPLTPGASVAVDRRHWKLGTVFFVDVSQERPALRFSRPVVAQDTGGAIQGAIRFDYFWGTGDAAGRRAGSQKSSAKAWVLVPNGHEPAELLSGHPAGRVTLQKQ